MGQVRGSAAMAVMMTMVTVSMLFDCQAAKTVPLPWEFFGAPQNPITLNVGDTLTFTYAAGHNVVEVDESGYTNCSPTGSKPPLPTGSPTAVTFNAAGTRYFICTAPTHCYSFYMKIKVTAK